MLKKRLGIIMICLLMMTNTVLGLYAKIEPEMLVKRSDMVVLAQIIEETGMTNKSEMFDRSGGEPRFTADTQWKIEVCDILKNRTNREITKGEMTIVTPGAKEATMHMSTDYELGEKGIYVLLFLRECMNEDKEIYYVPITPQGIVILKAFYPNDRTKTLQINNIADEYREESYYIRCFEEIEKWIRKVESNEPVYLMDSEVREKYELEGFIRENHTYFASKDLGEALGVKVEWKEKARILEIKDSGKSTIELILGSTTAKVNGKEVTLEVAPIFENGKSYLPVRILVQLLGKDISYIKQGNNYIYTISLVNTFE